MRRLALLGVVVVVTALACGGSDDGASGDVNLEPVDESAGETTTEATEAPEPTATTVAVADEAPDEGDIRDCLGAAGVELSGPDEELPPLSASVAIGVLPGQGSFDPGGYVGVIFLFESEDDAQFVSTSEVFASPSTFVSGPILVALDGSEPPEVLAALQGCTA